MAENNIDPEQIRQINEALLDLTGTVRQAEIAMANLGKANISRLNKAAKDTEDESKRNSYRLAKQMQGADLAALGLEHLGEAGEKTVVKLGKLEISGTQAAIGLDALGTAASGFIKGTLQMAKALHEGERGAEVGAKAVTTFAESISNAMQLVGAAMMFIPGLGIATKIAGAALTVFGEVVKKSAELNDMGAKQNDKVFKSFQELSKSGLVASRGMTDVFNNLQTMRMTTAELEKFNSLLVGNSKDLKMFGATTADGATQFAKVAGGVYDGFNKSLGMLGVTADEQREHTLKYMAQQTRMGLIQGKSVNDLVKGSKNYIEELDRLAMLTGASRKEQEEARDAILKIEELRAAMYVAEQSGDKAEAARLEKYLKVASALQVSGDTRGAAGAAEFAAGKGIVGEKSAAFFQTYKGTVNAINEGKSTAEALVEGTKSAGELMKQVARTKAVGGDVKPMLTGDFATMADNQKRMEEALKLVAANPKLTIEEALKKLQQEKIDKADPKTKANVEMAEAQQRVAIKLDTVLDKYFDAAKIHKMASEAMLKAADLIADLANHLLDKNGIKPPNTNEAFRGNQRAQSDEVARNELKQGRIGKEEAKAILANGSKRDIDAFGGKELLEKIASGAITSQEAAKTAPAAMPPINRPSRSNTSSTSRSSTSSSAAPATATPAMPPGGTTSAAPSGGSAPDYNQEGKNTGGGAQEPKKRTGGDGVQGSPRKSTEAAIFHHTGGRSLSGAVSTLQSRDLAYHYMIDRDGKIVPFMADNAVAYHAGPTDKNPKVGNWNTIGIAAVANNNEDVTKEQMTAAINLNQDLSGKFGYGTQNVFGHGQVTSRKGASEGMALVNAVKGGVKDTNPQAKYGGILSGPMSGYPVTMHGTEAIIPLSTNSLLEKLGTMPATSLEKPASTSSEMNTILTLLSEKFDQMIDKLTDGVNIQDKILKYSRT